MTVMVPCAQCGTLIQKRTDHLKSQQKAHCSRRCAGLSRMKPDATWPSQGPSRNPVAVKAYHRVYQRKQRARINEMSARWRAANHAKRLAVQKAWRLRNKRHLADAARDRRGAGRHGAPVDFEAIMRRDKMICHLCRGLVTKAALHFDHVIPLAKGGAHTEANIAISHRRCNQAKGAKIVTLF